MCSVSGKGGVGKTMLAANVAWQCSKVATTLLVDADFQNQGCTGLMAPHFDLHQLDTFTSLRDRSMIGQREFISLSAGLYFSPAVSWDHKPLATQISEELDDPAFGGKFGDFVKR
jgi:cellulose biosynthesis protein BcsQ